MLSTHLQFERGGMMFDSSIIMFNRVLVMFLIMLVGFHIFRKGIFNNDVTAQIGILLNTYITPCNIIKSFQRDFDPALAKELGGTFVIALLLFAISIILANLAFPKECADARIGVVLTNNGFMVVPLMDALFGTYGVFLGSAHIAAMAIIIWTYAVSQLEKNYVFSIKKILFSPGVLATLLSFLLFLSPVKLPMSAFTAVSLLADLNTPLAMLILGSYLAQIDFKQLVNDQIAWRVSALRLLAIPAFTVIILLALPLGSVSEQCLLIGMAAPSAISCAMFAQIYDTNYLFSTRVIALTTLLSLLTLPLWFTVFNSCAIFLG